MRTNGNNSPLPASFSSMADGRADSTYGMTLRDYASFAEAAGFEPIFEDAVGPEVFHAYGRADLGLLLTFDSYHGQRNSALVQFRTDRVAVRSDHALASLASCDALGPNGSQTHVALDARHGLLALMAEFERTGRLQPYWGNAEADGAIPCLTLGQDEAVARRSGVPASGTRSYLAEVALRRLASFPREWAGRLDLGRSRTAAQAASMGASAQ